MVPSVCASSPSLAIEVRGLTLRHGPRLLIGDIHFSVGRREIFALIGDSGCGKSTLLSHLIGLSPTEKGQVRLLGEDEPASRPRTFGVLFQGGALWTSMTLLENVLLPLQRWSRLPREEAEELAAFKLALVGLAGFENFYPHELSGGMVKRAGIARAMVLDPQILFLDEPSAGLDPVTAARLDELILRLRELQGTTVLLITHDLRSIFSIADRVAYLDRPSQSLLEIGPPRQLRARSPHAAVREFLSGGILGKTKKMRVP